MRRTCLNEIYNLAKQDERVFFIGSDLGQKTLDQFKQDLPERFFMEGISEQNVVGMAAGLAFNGKIPYVNTIASFITRRCFEQTIIDLALHNLKVRLVGNGGGMVYAPLGPTHMVTEDIAIMRAIPNMTVLSPCDAEEMKRLVPATLEHPGPVYIRLAKGGDRIVSSDDDQFDIGRAVSRRSGKKDILIVETGIMAQVASETAEILERRGIEASILHFHTIKPFDKDTLLEKASQVSMVITLEEHSYIGGLGSAALEVMAPAGILHNRKFKSFALPDCFPDQYGSQNSLLERFGLTAEKVAQEIITTLEA